MPDKPLLGPSPALPSAPIPAPVSVQPPPPLGPLADVTGFIVHGFARSLFVAPQAHACIREMGPRWREAALEALQMFADNGALWGTWGDEPRLGWRELCIEINSVKIYYFDKPEPFVVFHIWAPSDDADDDGGGGGFLCVPPSFFSAAPGVTMVGHDAHQLHLPADTSPAHMAALDALFGREMQLLDRALVSQERLWIDADGIFPVLASAGGDYFRLEVLRRQIWTREYQAFKDALGDPIALVRGPADAHKGETVAAPFGTDALWAWIEASISADWAPGRPWLAVDARVRRKAARALSVCAGTCLVGADLFIGAQGATRVDMKVLSATGGLDASTAIVCASAWSAAYPGGGNAAQEEKPVPCTHAMRLILLARHW
jgi:hypothetical protein